MALTLTQSVSIPSVQAQPNSALSFIFKEDFRTVMMVLFVLIEYNLRFIFHDQTPSNAIQQNPRASKKRQSDKLEQQKKKEVAKGEEKKQVEMQSVEEIQIEITQEINPLTSKQKKFALMEAIEQHLKLKIKEEKIREDQRLKVFIKFCLEHKKVINSFIRANQEVLNDSLRNVVI